MSEARGKGVMYFVFVAGVYIFFLICEDESVIWGIIVCNVNHNASLIALFLRDFQRKHSFENMQGATSDDSRLREMKT